MIPSFWHLPPQHADVVIVGGGLIGTSIALHLADRGIDVCLLERGFLASGASGRNDGQIILETVDYYPRMIELYGHAVAKSVLNFKRRGQMGLDHFLENLKTTAQLGYHRVGSLTLAYNEAEQTKIENAVAVMREDGFTGEIVDQKTIFEMIGSQAFSMGKFDPLDAVVNPAELTRLFAKEAANRGATISEGINVLGIDAGVVRFEGGSISSEVTLLATNAYTSSLIPSFDRWVFPTRGQVLATNPSDARFQPLGCITNFGYDYWHWTTDGRLILGGRRFVDEHEEVGTTECLNPKVQSALDQLIQEFYPDHRLQVAHRWSGIMGFSADGLPIVGPVAGDPTLWTAVGFTGYGLGMAWSVGIAVAQILNGEESPDTQEIAHFHPSRLS